jgi:hypothetical protein
MIYMDNAEISTAKSAEHLGIRDYERTGCNYISHCLPIPPEVKVASNIAIGTGERD